MADTILTLFLDSLMATLLLMTVFYCWKLNKRIRILQDSRSELSQIIRQFDESTKQATQSISDIHQAARNLTDNIQMKIDKASYLADDLEVMIDRSKKMATRMEADMGLTGDQTSTKRSRPIRKDSPSAKNEEKLKSSGKRVSHREALKETVEIESVPPTEASRIHREAIRKKPSLDEVVKKPIAKEVRGATESEENIQETQTSRRGSRLRSKAEKELFEALKTGTGAAA